MNTMLLGLGLSGGPVAVGQPPIGYAEPAPDSGFYPALPNPRSGPLPPPRAVPYPPGFHPPAPLPAAPVLARPLTVGEFAQVFVPKPGVHRVVLIHPKTGRPVEVCFRLPAAARPPRVEVSRRALEFDFGKEEVRVIFRHNGTVDVDYDD